MTIQVYQSDDTGFYYLQVGTWLGGVVLKPLRGGDAFEIDREFLEQRFEKIAEHEISS